MAKHVVPDYGCHAWVLYSDVFCDSFDVFGENVPKKLIMKEVCNFFFIGLLLIVFGANRTRCYVVYFITADVKVPDVFVQSHYLMDHFLYTKSRLQITFRRKLKYLN